MEEYYYIKESDDDTENVNESKNVKKPITDIIKTVLGDYINCYICKIKFKKSFTLNHFSSNYHKYNAKIFNEVLERYQHVTSEPVRKFDDQCKMATNYCDVCNLELIDNEKDEHLLSELHNKNESYVQNAMKLADVYILDSKICNKIVEDDSEEAMKKQSDGTICKILSFIKQYFVRKVGNKSQCRICGINVHAHNEILTHIKVDHQVVLNSDNVVSSIKINNELNIESCKQISIITVKNVILVIAADAWHGLSEKTCFLCNNKQFSDKVEHIQNQEHVHKLFGSSLIDANAMRELNFISRFNCLVCQKIIAADKYYNHLKSIDHRINYGEAVNKSCYKSVVKEEIFYHCSICGFDVPDIYKERHESGPRHYFNVHFMKTIKVDIDEPTVVNIIDSTTKKNKNKGKGSISNLNYTCETCNCQVQVSAKDQHESGTRHKKKIQNKIIDSNIRLIHSKTPEIVNEGKICEVRKNNTKSKYSTKKKKTKPNVPGYLQQWSNILQREEQCQTDLNISNDKSYVSCPDDEEQVNDNLESSLIIEEMDGEINDKPEYTDMWRSLLQDDKIDQEDDNAKCFNSTGIEFGNLNMNESNLSEETNRLEITFQTNVRLNKNRIKVYENTKKDEKKATVAKSLEHNCNQSFNLNVEESRLIDVTNKLNSKNSLNSTSNESIRGNSLNHSESESSVRHKHNILQKASNDNVDKDFFNDLMKDKTDVKDANISNVDTQQTVQICKETTNNDEDNLSDLEKLQNRRQTMQNETEKFNIKKDYLVKADNQIQSVIISVEQDKNKGFIVSDTGTESKLSINKVNNKPSTARILETTLPQNLDSNNDSDSHSSNDFKNIVLSSTTNSDDDKQYKKSISRNNGASFKSDAEDDTKMKFNNDLININNDDDDISEGTEELSKNSFAETGIKVYQVLNKIFGEGDILNENNINYVNELNRYKYANKIGTKCKACNIIVKKSELSVHYKSQQHMKTLNRSLQRNAAVSPNSDIVTIEFDDKVLNINSGNYNGLLITAENKVWCTFCECHAMTVDHVYDERHIDTMKKYIITSKDCLRIIDVGFAHCSLCNLIIQTGDNHTQTDGHIANLLKCIRTR